MLDYLPSAFVVFTVAICYGVGIYLYHQKKTKDPGERLIDSIAKTHVDQISRAELWDAYPVDFLITHQKELNETIKTNKTHLQEIVKQINGHQTFCSIDDISPPCAMDTGEKMSDNYETFSQELKKYRDNTKRAEKLKHYLRKRCMDEALENWLNHYFSNAYRVVEVSVLCLIMIVLILLFYELYLPDGEMSTATRFWIIGIDVFACLVFQFEFFARLYHTDSKLWYWKTHWIDFISSFPLTIFYLGIPQATMLDTQWLRLIRLGRLVRALRIASYLWRGMERLEQVANVDMMRKSLKYMIGIIILGGLALYAVEGPNYQSALEKQIPAQQTKQQPIPTGNQQDNSAYAMELDKSIWWSATTLATGGYGDLYRPQTKFGWAITFMVIIAGIVVVGVFTATLTSVFRGQDSDAMSKQIEAHHAKIMQRLNDMATHPDKTRVNKGKADRKQLEHH